MPKQKQNRVLLIILDGYGKGKKYKGNAIELANTPVMDELNKKHPHTLLDASGHAVGVPKGVMGASEPGHVTLGAGRVVWQPFEEINLSIKDKSFFEKKALIKACEHAQKKNVPLHLIGLLSDGGIHSHQKHLYALLKLAKKQKVKEVLIHAITDGRDVPERSFEQYLKDLHKNIKKIGIGQLASVIGRFYAMDRDKNWKRTETAYNLFTRGKGEQTCEFMDKIKDFFKTAKQTEATDYYLPPLLCAENYKPISDKDSVIFFNYRSDRAKQLTRAFTEKGFSEFKNGILPKFVCMGPYSHIAPVVFPPNEVKNNLGETLSKAKKKQLRIAETEKYAHVTFFFNSQVEEPYNGEDRILIQSPKVSNYADKPEMSAYEVTKKVVSEIKKEKYDFILLNYANPDLVGHGGRLDSVIKAIEVLDECTEKVVKAAEKHAYDIIITADHGNAEEMFYYGSNVVCPAHTTNPVNCILISDKVSKLKKKKGLKDIAPTVLELLEMKKPKAMTGESIILE